MKLKLKDLEVKSFVTKGDVVGGAPLHTQRPCESVDYCLSVNLCPPNTDESCIMACR